MNAVSEIFQKGVTCFLNSNQAGGVNYSLTPLAESTAYARCFAIFLMMLLKQPFNGIAPLAQALKNELQALRACNNVDITSKPYRQLLTFSLSAFAALGVSEESLEHLVVEQISSDVEHELMKFGCLQGKAGSGNQAMFQAIFLLHARDRLGLDTQSSLDQWVELHLSHMNRFGFWGPQRGMTHLQFQNGYHQYEIFEYLGIDNPKAKAALNAVRSLADPLGHFAPYPGGGGCYDYDAVFVLTPGARVPDDETRVLLERTKTTLISEQRPDGGFAESIFVRPRSLANLVRFVARIGGARNASLLLERLRYGLTLQRLKHDRIHTHWSQYSRRWDESNLWDSWFRLLAFARIEVALDPKKAADWGFINYPGIGYHPSLALQSRK